MKTVHVVNIKHPDQGKGLTVDQLLQVTNLIYSEEVQTSNNFFTETDPNLIGYLLDVAVAKSTNDYLYVIDGLDSYLLEMMSNAFIRAGKELKCKITLMELTNGEVKSLTQTMGVYDGQIHYVNLLPMKANVINDYLKT